jgi:epoxyqueuosine reductase
MSNYHSTLSRRDFMKALGLGGLGLGAAAVMPGAFRDLDEAMASPQAEFKRPSWVKEVDKPTTEVDWTQMKRFNMLWNMRGKSGINKYIGPEAWDTLGKAGAGNVVKFIKENRPGFTLRDWALAGGGGRLYLGGTVQTFLGPRTSPTPEALGVPRWEGTPEENSRMIRTFLRLHGCTEVSYSLLETDTTEKLIYSHDNTGQPYDILDVDQPSETKLDDGLIHRVIPKKARYVIVYAIRMPDELVRRVPTHFSQKAAMLGYEWQAIIQGWLQNFMRTLGYMCLGWHDISASLAPTTPFGILAGLGEQGRTMHLVTPEHGQTMRIFQAFTDMPLSPGKPIDFGVMKFCRVCRKCADFCPAMAIPQDTEPSWKVTGDYQKAGARVWFRNEPRCRTYMAETSGVCGVCIAVCPFSKLYKTPYHDVVRTITAKTPTFDRFFRKMDDLLGYGLRGREDLEKFWETDLPPFGLS